MKIIVVVAVLLLIGFVYNACSEDEEATVKPWQCTDDNFRTLMIEEEGWWEAMKWYADHCES